MDYLLHTRAGGITRVRAYDEPGAETTYSIWYIFLRRLKGLRRAKPLAYRVAVQESLDTWFKREILAHEAALLRYLNRLWRNQDDVLDIRQEIYARIYEAARQNRPHSPKSFLFTTARNLLADRVRRGRIVSIEAVGNPEALNVTVDELSPERRLTSWQDLKLVMRALNELPPRCREVVWLRKVDELSTKDVAKRLGLSERTVEGQIVKGMRRLTDSLMGRGEIPFRAGSEAENQDGRAIDKDDYEHGE